MAAFWIARTVLQSISTCLTPQPHKTPVGALSAQTKTCSLRKTGQHVFQFFYACTKTLPVSLALYFFLESRKEEDSDSKYFAVCILAAAALIIWNNFNLLKQYGATWQPIWKTLTLKGLASALIELINTYYLDMAFIATPADGTAYAREIILVSGLLFQLSKEMCGRLTVHPPNDRSSSDELSASLLDAQAAHRPTLT
jgi:hypothetical protein